MFVSKVYLLIPDGRGKNTIEEVSMQWMFYATNEYDISWDLSAGHAFALLEAKKIIRLLFSIIVEFIIERRVFLMDLSRLDRTILARTSRM